MKKKIFFVTLAFISILIITTVIFCISLYNKNTNDVRNEQLVKINEIQQLINNGEYEEAKEKLNTIDSYLRETSNSFDPTLIIINTSISISFVIIIFLYIYFAILRPFDKLKDFAKEIARGNFNLPLNYERSNYFGQFTWAFDSMRLEITKARKCEAEAIENNKTVIAGLSHDIKTPIASIIAYAEALEANIDSNYMTRVKYLNVIMNKATEVKKLTDDLFLHSVSEMDKLSFNLEKLNLLEILKSSINDFNVNSTINLNEYVNDAYIMGDRIRIGQIFENIINNSIKYANTKIDISLIDDNDYYLVTIKDYGNVIDDNDMPFIFDKFYRGNNSIGKNGTGLGLYIVKYMIEKLDGKVLIENSCGLLVKLFFKKIIS
jgi:signal transduction histidine kinase